MESRPPPRRGFYLLPNLLTTGCLFSGFYAIVAAIDAAKPGNGNFQPAGIAVFIAMIFDGLDGRIARLTRTDVAIATDSAVLGMWGPGTTPSISSADFFRQEEIAEARASGVGYAQRQPPMVNHACTLRSCVRKRV